MDSDAQSGIGSALSLGVGLASGNPMAVMSGAIGLAGLGLSLFGGAGSASASRQIAQASARVAALEMDQNAQRRKQMVLNSQRQQLQVIRNSQLARSMALTAATNQGAQYGSGLAGGLGQISSDAAYQGLGINQNLIIGQHLFDDDAQISQQKMLMARLQGKAATSQGLSSMGSSLMRAAGPLGNMSGQFFGSSGVTNYSGVTPNQSDFWNSGNVGPVQ